MPRFEADPLFHDRHVPETVGVSREAAARLRKFCDSLAEWNTRIRLTQRVPATQLWTRHVVPCLALQQFVPPEANRIVDLGSGQGFPGMVLAIATGIETFLVEADRRKAAFLRHACMAIELPVTVICDRIERIAPLDGDFVTARAVGVCRDLVVWGHRHVSRTGSCVFPKGPEVATEFESLPPTDGHTWSIQPWLDHQFLLVSRPVAY